MALGSRNPFGERGSIDFDQAELFAGDPSVAPGLARPVGWRVRSPDGLTSFYKFGPNDTDWVALGGSGIGWFGTVAAPFAVQALKAGNATIKHFEFADFLRQNEASTGATLQTNQTGGVYRFAANNTEWSFLGSQKMLASPTSDSWCVMSLVKLVGTPVASDLSCWCAMNDGTNNERICFELNGPTSTTIADLRFDRAASITRVALNGQGTIGGGGGFAGITIGAWTTFALVYLTATNVVTAYVNGIACGSRNDISTLGPTQGLTPWVQQPFFLSGTFDLDAVAFFST